MATDSKSFARKEAARFFPGPDKAGIRSCFCALSKMLHATHDLIQDLGPFNNEIATYEIVRDRVKLNLERAGIN